MGKTTYKRTSFDQLQRICKHKTKNGLCFGGVSEDSDGLCKARNCPIWKRLHVVNQEDESKEDIVKEAFHTGFKDAEAMLKNCVNCMWARVEDFECDIDHVYVCDLWEMDPPLRHGAK